MKQSTTPALTVLTNESIGSTQSPVVQSTDPSLPALIDTGGPAAQFAWEEFIYAEIRNPHTRELYGRAVTQFLRHCEKLGRDLPNISPRDVATYFDQLTHYAPATKKLHLSRLRYFFH